MTIEDYKNKKYWISTNRNNIAEGVVKVINDKDFKPTTDTLKQWLSHYDQLEDEFYPLHTKGGSYFGKPFSSEEWVSFRYLFVASDKLDIINPLRIFYVPSSWFRDYSTEL